MGGLPVPATPPAAASFLVSRCYFGRQSLLIEKAPAKDKSAKPPDGKSAAGDALRTVSTHRVPLRAHD
jgi:hypothetical protein